MDNRDKVVEYILKNASKLTPDRIKALADVVKAIGDEKPTVEEPNMIPEESETNSILEEQPFDLSEIKRIQIDKNKSIKTKIIS